MQRIYDKVESRPERYELNLYITGYDEARRAAGRRRHGRAAATRRTDTEGSAA